MLVRLTPEQVSNSWDAIKPSLLATMPPVLSNDPNMSIAMLRSILGEDAICWAMLEDSKPESPVQGLVLTSIVKDVVTGLKSLVLYAMCAMPPYRLSEVLIRDAINTLKKYAKGSGHFNLIAYSNQPAVARLARKLGGRIDYQLLEFDLEDIADSPKTPALVITDSGLSEKLELDAEEAIIISEEAK